MFDSCMAIKPLLADFCLAKNEMERDYLVRTCQVEPGRVVAGGPAQIISPAIQRRDSRSEEPSLVFFTEPFAANGWRNEQVYRELLPRLWSLAQSCRLRLVFKLHTFESIRGHRRLLRKCFPLYEPQIEVVAGLPSEALWRNAKVAVAVQSTAVLECAARDIPVFLCAWLRDPYAAYVQQYERFGIGRVLQTPEQINDIPRLLAAQESALPMRSDLLQAMDPGILQGLFSGTLALPVLLAG
jgi:hypothetical protein